LNVISDDDSSNRVKSTVLSLVLVKSRVKPPKSPRRKRKRSLLAVLRSECCTTRDLLMPSSDPVERDEWVFLIVLNQ
jgi:hypothetical protein